MKRFTYHVDGRFYFLNPYYRESAGGRIWLEGCEMYDKDGEYVGYWYRHNMPVNLITEITKHVKVFLGLQPRRVGRPRKHQHR